jgi:hypothetical protein
VKRSSGYIIDEQACARRATRVVIERRGVISKKEGVRSEEEVRNNLDVGMR